jgi:acetylornithine/succinyldiaminopimelate/putrescine aminotransferase
VLWYPGGQIGHIFVVDRYYIKKPLVLISTWDGDELSAIRTHEHLRAARKLDLAAAAAALDASLTAAFAGLPGARLGGLGLYRTITLADADAAEAVYQACLHHGLQLGRGLPDTLIAAPALDAGPLLGAALRDMLAAALPDTAEHQP